VHLKKGVKITVMDDAARREYVALRDTIRERGGLRVLAFLAGLAAWAVVLVAVLVWLPTPVASMIPLMVLLGTFEVVRSLHLTVERIGRYVQVFFEQAPDGGAPTAPPCWEHTAMAFGPTLPGAGVHPFFLPVFLLAILTNYLAVLFPGPVQVELGALAVPHVALILWIVRCVRAMRRQRGTELARYRELRGKTVQR
jgi:hypothetical protein